MSTQPKIKCITADEILDSRGWPTVCATVTADDGCGAYASIPSGASTGSHEAHEKRDLDLSRYMGKGVLSAIDSINCTIAPKLEGCPLNQGIIDSRLISIDGTENKEKLGGNATLAVSLACARVGALCAGQPLFRYLGGINSHRMPIPMMNILNGGAHASNNADIQEFMIMPVGFSSFREALRAGSEIYHTLGKILKSDGKSTAVGDEGGFAPDCDSEPQILDYLVQAITESGYDTNRVKIALDAAATEWYSDGKYILPKSGEVLSKESLIERWEYLCENYPIVSIEDPLAEDDFGAWEMLTERLGKKIMLVGDDLFVTNEKRLREGVSRGIANSVLIKPNQIGTLSETMAVMNYASDKSYKTIVSHRSGETEDTAVADIAVAMNAGFVKFGAPCRGERTAKYNRLLRIENQLGASAVYGIV
ncbi:MAG: phosphopyruvate hydratase [Clostridia bacterium]|nr:phosphopyruvate hydratase [Clostridia bacterium]